MTRLRDVVAVVLAGGSGTRTGLAEPKQFLRLGGKTLLARSVAAFETSEAVDEIVVVAARDHIDQTRNELAEHDFTKVVAVVTGGAERHDSSRAALEYLGQRDVDVLIHDAARPFVSQTTIDQCVEALVGAEVVEPVLPSVDTLVQVIDGQVTRIVPREEIFRVQTPQGFRANILRQAFNRAREGESVSLTDDVAVVLRYLPDVVVVSVAGDERNLKITTAADIELAMTWTEEGAST